MLMHRCIQVCSECDCRYMGQAAVAANATNVGQNGNNNASISSKDPDTAATHFAGNHIITLLEQYKLAFLTYMSELAYKAPFVLPCTTHQMAK